MELSPYKWSVHVKESLNVSLFCLKYVVLYAYKKAVPIAVLHVVQIFTVVQ